MAKKSADNDGVIRVVTLPIRSVWRDDPEEELTGNPPEQLSIIDTFRPAWQMATDLANWAQCELMRRDVRRLPEHVTLPKYDRERVFGRHPRQFARKAKGDKPAGAVGELKTGDLYGTWNREYPPESRRRWDDATVVARDILTAVEKTWIGHKSFGRFAVLWRNEARACTFRFPYALPLPSQNVILGKNAEGRPFASVVVSGDGIGNRLRLQLADGREFRRQLAQLDKVLENPSRLRQCRISGRRSGGRLVGADLRIVARFDSRQESAGVTAELRTGKESLLSVVVGGDDGNPFVYHGDQLRGVTICQDAWRKRFADDLKFEKRWPADKRRRSVFGSTVQARQDHANNRLRSERQQIAACVVGYLVRNGVSHLDYDDSERGFLPRFGWAHLRDLMRFKCQDAGIQFQLLSEVNDGEN